MTRSDVSSTEPPPSRKTASTAARIAPRRSSELTASPNSIAGNASSGSTNRVAVESSPTAVSAVVVVATG